MSIIYFIFAAIALGILVFIHELGHFFVARLVGMKVEIFSIGFGRPILRWRWLGVDWQLGWLPFGGYVKIAGMELGKKDKNTYVEPYEVPDGFFGKSPLARICVALAGPFSNFLLALLVFIALWGMGGREKNFSEFTQIIGWVDPKSELFALGLRPGDIITQYNGKPFTGAKDLLYAAMIEDKEVVLEGYHVDYRTKQKTPYSYKIQSYQSPSAIDGILTTGILSGGRYLIYERFPGGQANPLSEGSPMEESAIAYGDRLMWADGLLLFSKEQLSHLLNDGKALLTVQRNGKQFLTRQPRVPVWNLILPTDVKDELSDWQHAVRIQERWNQLRVLPYNISTDCVVEGHLNFIDDESELEAFPKYPLSEELERPLQRGDKIIAVDGFPVRAAYELLDHLQKHQIIFIVQRDFSLVSKVSWKKADIEFEHSFDLNKIDGIAKTIGGQKPIDFIGDYLLLAPVEPKKAEDFSLSPDSLTKLSLKINQERKGIEETRDPEKRAKLLQEFQKTQNQYLLGIQLQDLRVVYNPSPFALFGSVFSETWLTLKALILGYLHPKWLSGPIGIVQVIHHGWQVGIGEALFWIGAISVNLAFLNLLPIPVLDGGYICLSLWELITRRRLKAKTIERLIIPFVVLLIALLIFLTFQDISRLL